MAKSDISVKLADVSYCVYCNRRKVMNNCKYGFSAFPLTSILFKKFCDKKWQYNMVPPEVALSYISSGLQHEYFTGKEALRECLRGMMS